MKSAQTDVLRLVYYYSVGIRHIKTVLYDGRAKQHVIISCHEIQYLVFQYLGFHLSMSHTNLHVRH